MSCRPQKKLRISSVIVMKSAKPHFLCGGVLLEHESRSSEELHIITELFKLEVQSLDNTKWLLKQNVQMVKIFHSESRVASPSPSVHSTGVFGFRDPTILQGS